MRKLIGLLLVVLPFCVKAQTQGSISFGKGKDPIYIIDSKKANKSELAGLNADDIADIRVLNSIGGRNLFGAAGANGVVDVITKKFAVSSYQKVLSSFSNEYRLFLAANGTDDRKVIYIVNTVPVIKGRSETSKLFQLRKEQIKSVEFVQVGDKESKIMAKVIITIKK